MTHRGVRAAAVALAGMLLCYAAAAGADAGRVRAAKGPYLTALSDTGVEVRLELDAPASVTLEVRADDGGSPRTATSPAATMHAVRVDGLAASTHYSYVTRAGADAVGKGTFTTAPGPGSSSPVTFTVYGDNRSDDTAHAAVLRAVAQTHMDFLVNTGDLVENGGDAEMWQAFFDIEANLLRNHPLFVAIGNHELYEDRAGAAFARYFGFPSEDGTRKPYGTVRWGSIRFFFMNAMHDWGGGEERAWLERELARADGEAGLVWRIAVTHHPPWSSGPHGGNARLLDAHVPELLRAHNVDLLFGGHDHIYERGEAGGMKYIISGGGGAQPYRIERKADTAAIAESTYHFVQVTADGDTIRVLAKRVDGSTLDECAFAKEKAWSCGGAAAAAALAPPAPTDSPARSGGSESTSRCGCSVLGVAGGGVPVVGLAGAAIALLRRRKRKC